MNHRRTNPITFSHAHELRHNQTDTENKLWQALRAHQTNNMHFRRQHAIGPYIVDFCAPNRKIIVELDGNQHLDQKEYDDQRTAYLETKGYRVLRFWNNEVLENLDGVLQIISDLEKETNKAPKL